MSDFGLAVSPDYRRSVLRRVSPGAKDVWLLLASMATHVSGVREIGGHRLRVEPSEVLVGLRTLKRELGYGFSRLLGALDELKAVGAVEIATIGGDGKVFNPAAQALSIRGRPRSQTGSTRQKLISRIKVNGLKPLPRQVGAPISGALSTRAATGPLTRRDVAENTKAERILQAEGR